MLGLRVRPDLVIADVDPAAFDGLVLVGGAGAMHLAGDTLVRSIVKAFDDARKPIGAICLAPVILARAGVLKGIKATVYPSSRDELEKGGAVRSKADVEVAGRIVTASGPKAALPFAKAFYRRLSK
jgi:protease I